MLEGLNGGERFPQTRTTTFDEALVYIESESSVWIRFGAVRDERLGWYVRMLELTSGAEPPSWPEGTWEYPDALFATVRYSGSRTSEILRSSVIKLRGYEFQLPGKLDTVTWERRQSYSRAAFETLEWPVVEVTLSVMGAVSAPVGHQVSSEDAPSFVTFDAAAAAFFGLDLQLTNMQIVQGAVFRFQDLRGRINAVQISAETLEVTVEGQNLGELEVELAGDAPGQTRSLESNRDESPQSLEIELAGGLPSGAWVLLRKGSEWIDRRFLTVPYTSSRQAGVEVVVEAGARLEILVSGRERQNVEFKRQLPSAEESKRNVMKTVAAFANCTGGSILIGVDDDRNIIGVPTGEVERLRDRVTHMISSWVEPWPPVDFDILPMADSDRVVLEIRIVPGSGLYGCGRPGETRTPYVRHFGVTERATVSEIENIVRLRSPSASGATFLGF